MDHMSFDTSGRVESEQERKERELKKSLRNHKKRLRKHPNIEADYYTKTQWIEGRESPTLPINQTEGFRLGRKDAKESPRNERGVAHYYPNKYFGRVSRQSPFSCGEPEGYDPLIKDKRKAKFHESAQIRGYKPIEFTKSEKLTEKREAEYLVNNPSWNPEKAKWNAKSKEK